MDTSSVVLYFLGLLQLSVCIDFDGWLNIKIQHTLNCKGEQFCSRGNISLKSIRSGTSVIEQINFNKQHIEELKVVLVAVTLVGSMNMWVRLPDLKRFKNLKLADIDGFYSIRTLVTSADNKETEFLSSVKAQTFLDNGLSDVINAWILPNGAVIAVNFQVANGTQPLVHGGNNDYKLKSNFYLRHIDQAPVPDTASYIQKLEREREAREKGELKDNRSFLAKYWMYIVPIAIFVMISGATNPEGAPAAR